MAGSPFTVAGPSREYAAFVAIVPSDAVNQLVPFSGLVCAVGGTVSLVDSQGNVASLTLAAGVYIRLPPCVRVNIAGTTATGLVGFA
jgi:hypothetical protein